MKLSIKAGATSQSVNVFVRDSSSTTGAGLGAVAPAGGSLLSGTKLYYSFSGASAASAAISLSVLATVGTAWTTAGIVTIDGTNMLGWVRIDIPNAALAGSSGRSVSFLLFGGTNMAPTPFEIELTGWDNQDAVHGGMSALPNTACTTNGSLLTSGSGTAQINPSSGKVPATLASTDVTGNVAADLQTIKTQAVTCAGGVTVPAATLASTVNITAGTITTTTNLTNAPPDSSGVTTLLSRIGGALTISGGAVNASLVSILGTALTETAGQLAAGFKKFFNVASPTSTMNEITLVDTITTYTGDTPQTGDSYARIGSTGSGLTSLASAASITTLSSHGDSTWSTATGFATAASLASLTTTVGVAGAGLTALGDTRIAHLNADVTSRMATYTQPTGFLAAAFPTTGTVAKAGDQMDLVNAPNATAVTDIQSGLATAAGLTSLQSHGDSTWSTATGFATSSALTSLQSHGDSNWATATMAGIFSGSAMTESYAADGATMTPAQALYQTYSLVAQVVTSGTSIFGKKLDGTTTWGTFTVDSATAPTERTRTG